MLPALGLLIAYLAGSFPSAYLAGRLVKGVDLRTVGSGNLGATNVYRNLGSSAALAVLVIDLAKGALPVLLLPGLLHGGEAGTDARMWWALGYGVAAIAGHAKPIFLLWKGGGKGVATATGVFLVLAPSALLATVIVCIAVVWYSGYMSLGSITAAALFPLLVWFKSGVSPVLWGALAIAAFICWTHRTNMRRLRDGTEPRLFKKSERKGKGEMKRKKGKRGRGQ
jgi:glycerol-3-phosphate acyltransferase PlsY